MKRVRGALIVVSMLAAQAAAQAPASSGNSTALAEQLFNQARDLVKADQWAEACPKFEASLRYDPVLGTRLNLATCYEHVGKLASAWGLYRESIELARKAGDAKRMAYAQRQAAALEPRLPKLAISAPANPPEGLVIERDDTPLNAGALGVALYVDPGPHRVTAAAPGFVELVVSITVGEGKTELVAIPPLVAAPREEAAEAAPPPSDPPRRRAGTRTYAAIGVGAAGVAAIGVSVVFGLKARSSNNDAKALCGADLACPPDDYTRGKQLVADARSSATVSTVALIGGGAAIAAAAIVYLTASRTGEPRSARVVPVTHAAGAGLALTGTF